MKYLLFFLSSLLIFFSFLFSSPVFSQGDDMVVGIQAVNPNEIPNEVEDGDHVYPKPVDGEICDYPIPVDGVYTPGVVEDGGGRDGNIGKPLDHDLFATFQDTVTRVDFYVKATTNEKNAVLAGENPTMYNLVSMYGGINNYFYLGGRDSSFFQNGPVPGTKKVGISWNTQGFDSVVRDLAAETVNPAGTLTTQYLLDIMDETIALNNSYPRITAKTVNGLAYQERETYNVGSTLALGVTVYDKIAADNPAYSANHISDGYADYWLVFEPGDNPSVLDCPQCFEDAPRYSTTKGPMGPVCNWFGVFWHLGSIPFSETSPGNGNTALSWNTTGFATGNFDRYVYVNVWDEDGNHTSWDKFIAAGRFVFRLSGSPPVFYTISGNIYLDYNHNNAVNQNGGDGPFNDQVSIKIENLSTGGVMTRTFFGGSYSFPGLSGNANYRLTILNPAGHRADFPGANNPRTIFLDSNKTGVDFYVTPIYTLSGRLFVDVDRSSKYNPPPDYLYTGLSVFEIRNGKNNNCSGSLTTTALTVTGSYTASNIVSGDYSVCYTSLPSGFNIFYLPGSNPPNFPATLGKQVGNQGINPWCNVYFHNNAQCDADWGELNGNISRMDFGITNLGPWFQGIGADLRIDSGFSNPIPAGNPSCTPYSSLSGAGGTPGIVFSGDVAPDFGDGQASQNPNNWLVGGAEPPGYKELFSPFRNGVIRTSYNYMTATASQNGISPADLSTVSGCSDLLNCTLPASLSNGVYKADGNLILLGTGSPLAYTFPANKNFVFLVNGDLTIKTRLIVPPGSTVTFSSARDIIIDKSVEGVSSSGDAATTNINGLFSADRNFVIQGNGALGCGVGGTKDKRLNIGGSVVVNAGFLNGSFINERDICGDSANCPAYSFIERPDFILNAPDFIKHRNLLWQEVAP